MFWKCAWVKTAPLKSAGAKDPVYFAMKPQYQFYNRVILEFGLHYSLKKLQSKELVTREKTNVFLYTINKDKIKPIVDLYTKTQQYKKKENPQHQDRKKNQKENSSHNITPNDITTQKKTEKSFANAHKPDGYQLHINKTQMEQTPNFKEGNSPSVSKFNKSSKTEDAFAMKTVPSTYHCWSENWTQTFKQTETSKTNTITGSTTVKNSSL